MTTDEKNIEIIGNESNQVFEIESNADAAGERLPTTAEKVAAKEQLDAGFPESGAPRATEEITQNDGSLIETLNADFHGQSAVEDENPSGSDRADYYEARSGGKSDSEEELDALKGEQP